MFLKFIQISICFKISYDQKCENCDNFGLSINVLPIFRLYQKNTPTIGIILHQFKIYVLLICGKKLVTIKTFLLTFSGGQNA